MEDISSYCGNIDKVTDICSIYHSMTKSKFFKISDMNFTNTKNKKNEEEILQRLANLALNVNTSNGKDDVENLETINPSL